MLRLLVAFFVAGVVMVTLDAVWLTMMAPAYRRLIGDLLADGFRLAPAAAFYLLYAAGVVVFAVSPALREGGWLAAAGYGAFFGLVAYGTYDLTNQATLKTWPLELTIMDMAWGALITAVSAAAAAGAVQILFSSPRA